MKHIVCILMIMLGVTLAACGKKGDPEPLQHSQSL
jgi:predicted small lipoprotein YifL